MIDNKVISDRFELIKKKNVDLFYFIELVAEDNNCKKALYNHFPYTTVSVEREFSSHKNVLSDQRASLSAQKIFM